MFLRVALLVLKKDFAIEAKSLEIIATTLFFAASCILIFSFAFVKEGAPIENAAAGILWIAIAFSGTLALGRTFERERYSETLRALLLAPAPRPAIYVEPSMRLGTSGSARIRSAKRSRPCSTRRASRRDRSPTTSATLNRR